jgi:hypothetical protein
MLILGCPIRLMVLLVNPLLLVLDHDNAVDGIGGLLRNMDHQATAVDIDGQAAA